MTLGGSGCAIASRGARRRIAAPAVTVADTIGAGDSFMAGLLAAVLAGPRRHAPTALDEDDLGAWPRALACAAVTVSRPGADPPTTDELPADVRPDATP